MKAGLNSRVEQSLSRADVARRCLTLTGKKVGLERVILRIDAVLDASFMKARITRHPKDRQKGFSDAEARVGRTGRTFGLGYKLRFSIESESRLPLANVAAPGNENEKGHTATMLEKTRQILSNVGAKLNV